MTAETPLLHPLVPPGEFDLEVLLGYEPPTRWRPEPGREGDRRAGPHGRARPRSAVAHRRCTCWSMTSSYLTVRASGCGAARMRSTSSSPDPGRRWRSSSRACGTSANGHQYSLHRLAVQRAGRWVVASVTATDQVSYYAQHTEADPTRRSYSIGDQACAEVVRLARAAGRVAVDIETAGPRRTSVQGQGHHHRHRAALVRARRHRRAAPSSGS
jgi:hypothetical protein